MNGHDSLWEQTIFYSDEVPMKQIIMKLQKSIKDYLLNDSYCSIHAVIKSE